MTSVTVTEKTTNPLKELCLQLFLLPDAAVWKQYPSLRSWPKSLNNWMDWNFNVDIQSMELNELAHTWVCPVVPQVAWQKCVYAHVTSFCQKILIGNGNRVCGKAGVEATKHETSARCCYRGAFVLISLFFPIYFGCSLISSSPKTTWFGPHKKRLFSVCLYPRWQTSAKAEQSPQNVNYPVNKKMVSA